jgi:flagellar hook-associated protein 3 FlgL
MAINSINYGASVLSQSVVDLKNQLTTLQSQLTTGTKSTTYSGMGVNEGFAVAARAQLANISAFTDTMTNINTTIGVANTELQGLVDIGTTVQTGANSSNQTLNSSGQTMAQQTAASQLSSMIGILNMQSGDRYLFSGSAINTPSTAPVDQILNGTTTQAGLKQVIAQRAQADGTGTNGLGRLVISSSSTLPLVSVAEDAAGSPFGLKLNSVSSSLTGATVTGPAGSPAAVSINLGTTNPNPGDQVSLTFNLPDGTTQSIQLTASSTTPPPAGSFAIGTTPTATAANLNTALNTAIGTLANTSLVAASAVEAGNDFFAAGAVTGSAVKNQAATPAPVTGTTLLSGTAGTNSLGTGFAAGDTITVNGTPITFVASGATGNQLNVTDSVQTLLNKIDSITGTSSPSTISSSGAITLHTDDAGSLSVASSNSAAFAALGFTGTVTAVLSPLRVSSSTVNTATGSMASNQVAPPAPATGATLLSGTAGTDSLGASFAAGDTITVNGTPITFVASGATGNQLNVTDSVQTLLNKIDSITGTSTPSTISGGVIALHTDNAASLSVTSSNAAAFAALGFSGTVTAVSGSPLSSATSLVSGTPANTVSWYTGNPGPTGSARASATARVDQSVTVQYGAQANEQAILTQLQNLAVFAAFTASPTGANSSAQVSALSQRIAQNLSPQPGQQTIQDIQAEFATAQSTMKDAGARQTQTQSMLQNIVSGAESVSPDQVASEILALQTSLQASYQTTSMLSQLTLTKYLPIG